LSDPEIIFPEFSKELEDEKGWWHISCYYQFYAKVECTLHNQNIDMTRVDSLLGKTQYFFPKYSLSGVVGRTQNQIYPGVKNFFVKEFSYWSRKVMLPEVELMRYQQIDPVAADSLLSYFRLSQGIPEISNFAEMNPNYSFEDTSTNFLYASW